ncbi:hypothetical protein ACFL1B_01605 [Nanoarchaeota archaeon]
MGHDKDGCCGGSCGDKDNGYDEMTGEMLFLADKAWSHLVLDKMKEVWEKERGSNMDKAAEVAVKHSMDAWMARMSSGDMKKNLPKEAIDKFREDLNNAMKG